MTRPRLLDLFCGAGGASVGYHRAGFDVVGVDHRPQPRYPFEFHQADALTYPLTGFDAIHASPPCQLYSAATRASNTRHRHPDLVPPTREALHNTGRPWIMENVPGAPLDHPVTLCGAAFGLTAEDHDGRKLYLRRHRLFESNIWLTPVECMCLTYQDRGYAVGGVYGGGSATFERARTIRKGGYTPPTDVRQRLLGIDWMTQYGMSQAIPPAYTQYLGEQLLNHLQRQP